MSRFLFSALPVGITPTFGMGIADVNGDGHADIYVGKHGSYGELLLGDGAGGFIKGNITYLHGGDSHGVVFGDIDGDGDLDMIEATGGGLGVAGVRPTFLPKVLINQDGNLVEAVLSGDLGEDYGRGRNPLLIDLNGDGKLDLLMGGTPGPNGSYPARAYLGDGEGNFNLAGAGYFALPAAVADFVAGDLDGDGIQEVVFSNGPSRAITVMKQNADGSGWFDATKSFFGNNAPSGGSEIVLADLNSDGKDDIYISDHGVTSDYTILPDGTLRYAFGQKVSKQNSVLTFKADGAVTIDFKGDTNLNPDEVLIAGHKQTEQSVTLAPGDAVASGHSNGKVSIYYDDSTGLWNMSFDPRYLRAGQVRGEGIEVVDFIAPEGTTKSGGDRLYLSKAGGYQKAVNPVGDLPGGTSSVGVGDFDNDGNLDLYIARGTSSKDLEDIILMGRGDGSFDRQAGMGATNGVGDAVAIGDFNNDGLLDVVVSDGAQVRTQNEYGRYWLGLNDRASENAWLGLELVDKSGGVSPFGTQVSVNGQRQFYNGSSHGATQDDLRLHFGLGEADFAEVSVDWTSGSRQEFTLLARLLDRKWVLHESDFLTAKNQNVRGSDRDDLLLGGKGNDRLIGGDGNDYMDGGAGADTMQGGAGDDIYMIDNIGDVAMEAAGNGYDIAYVTAREYVARGHIERWELMGDGGHHFQGTFSDERIIGTMFADTIYGGGGNDYILGRGGDDHIIGENGNDHLAGGGGNDTLDGGNGNDTLLGGAGNDVLYGGAGEDILNGGPGADLMYGGIGNDTYYVNHFGDRVFEDADGGHDRVITTVNWGMADHVEDLVLDSDKGLRGLGNSLNNHITGGDGNDTLLGAQGDDVLIGGAGDDYMLGGIGADLLMGGAGRDTLHGGAGSDTLIGGADADMFVFGLYTGTDIVEDFEDGLDLLDITSMVGAADFASRVNIDQVGADTHLTVDGHANLIILKGIEAAQITIDDFIF